jgi:catechol 2,3-dioxygenase-like lactoylglutathione lyase family enzyme
MVKSTLGHIQFNIDPQNSAFYKELLSFLGWTVWFDDPNILGLGGEHGTSLWFTSPAESVIYDYDGPGMNHLALAVSTQSEVDEVVSYLQKLSVPTLFDTPRHRPEFNSGPNQTYYQVMFESPDRILFEVVYTGPKS